MTDTSKPAEKAEKPEKKPAVVAPPGHGGGGAGDNAAQWATEFTSALKKHTDTSFDAASIAVWFAAAMDAAHTTRVAAQARGVGPRE